MGFTKLFTTKLHAVQMVLLIFYTSLNIENVYSLKNTHSSPTTDTGVSVH